MRYIGIAVPTWKRVEQTIDSFAQVLEDERVEDVTIVDDASDDGSFRRLCEHFDTHDKVFLYRNDDNLDCYKNKHRSMQEAFSEFCILLDSDNIITPSYLDAIYAIDKWDRKTIYQPEYAMPHFDFRGWSGLTLTRHNVSQYVDTNLMTALNAMNFFINRDEYLKVWDGSVNPHTSDSIYFCYCWLAAGNSIFITPNLHYEHFIDPKGRGHYQTNYHKTGNFHKMVLDKIRQLS